MNLVSWITYQLYLLQLENYDPKRYLIIALKKWRRPKAQLKKELVWTKSVRLIIGGAGIFHAFVVTCILWITFKIGVTPPVMSFIGFVSLLLVAALLPFELALIVLILTPFSNRTKARTILKAKHKIAELKNLKIIGITGSYGKTTMKEALANLLEEKFRVLKTPENINTAIGVARLILDKLDPSVEVLIVEMGAYEPGDIKAICEITPPDIAILTGINESHLERFKSIENTIKTKFEIAVHAKPESSLILNADNALIKHNFPYYIKPDQKIFWYATKPNELSTYQIKKSIFENDGAGQTFEVWKGTEIKGKYHVPILGEYIEGVLVGAIIAAEILGVEKGFIDRGVARIKPVPHRLNPIKNPNGLLIIDDSYNGTPEGVHEAIKTLSRFANRRKIYLTPGLVEMGAEKERIHKEIGKKLAPVADLVMLVRTTVTPYIAEGLKNKNFKPENVHWYESSEAAFRDLREIAKPTDVILLQNDWPENYI